MNALLSPARIARPRRRKLRVGLVGLVAVSCLGLAATVALPAAASSASTPGHWTVLGANFEPPEGGTPAVWEDSTHHTWVLWLRKPTSSTSTYEAVELAPNGSVAKGPLDIFSGQDWGSLSGQPTLVPAGSVPEVVFTGLQSSTGPYSRGCVTGALGGTTPWTVQPWALSNNCVNPIGGAAESKTGVLATAFPGGWATGHGVQYHVGVSPAIPATDADGQIAIASGVAYKVSVGNDIAGSGDFSVVWEQEFSSPAGSDGYYVQDVTAGTPAVKAPGTGTNSLVNQPVFGNIALTTRTGHPGLYLAYCSNAAICKLQLWHVGSAKAMTIPGSSGASDVAVSAGPGGRIWVAWANQNTNRVFVTRTNQAVTKFGPVKVYSTPCFEHELLGLGSGTGRLVVAAQCVNNAKLQAQEMVTTSLVPVKVALSKSSLSNTAKQTLTVLVTDVGDPVPGAKVVVAGKKATTNSKGKATITLAKGTKAGSYGVKVTAVDYVAGAATLTVTH